MKKKHTPPSYMRYREKRNVIPPIATSAGVPLSMLGNSIAKKFS